MTDTPALSLPLLAPAQAQKHVTVNEALTRIDALAQLSLVSITNTTPPPFTTDGDVYYVPAGAAGVWAGQEGRIAVAANGGWIFVAPRRGWRAFVLDQGCIAVFDGSAWREGATTATPFGAGIAARSVEIDVDLTPGASVTTADLFPARSIALGVTGRVVSTITGSLTDWDLGIPGDPSRYGNGIGIALNSSVDGPGNPLVYWMPTPLQLTASGGNFASGTVRLAAHFMELSLPNPI